MFFVITKPTFQLDSIIISIHNVTSKTNSLPYVVILLHKASNRFVYKCVIVKIVTIFMYVESTDNMINNYINYIVTNFEWYFYIR